MRFYPPQTAISPLTLVQRERMLPVAGEILVREGQRVDPVHVIGRATVPGGFRIINVARSLSVSPRAVPRYLKVKVGQEVRRGDVLAARGRLSRQVCRAPIDGRVTGSGGGRILIEAPPQVVEVRAEYQGTVARVIPERGVILRVSGALIQAAWGNEQLEMGVLRVMAESREQVLKGRAIDANCRGTLLIGGSYLDESALERGAEIQVRGIIVGSVPPELLTKAIQAPFPVVATEGIGTVPMSSRVFQLLTTHDGREAILDGRFQSRLEVLRPEIIIPRLRGAGDGPAPPPGRPPAGGGPGASGAGTPHRADGQGGRSLGDGRAHPHRCPPPGGQGGAGGRRRRRASVDPRGQPGDPSLRRKLWLWTIWTWTWRRWKRKRKG